MYKKTANTIIFFLILISVSHSQVAWEPECRLTNDPLRSDSPSISSCSNGYLHVVWWDNYEGNPEIYYKRSTDGGLSWEGIQRLTNDPAGTFGSCVYVDPFYDYVHVVYFDKRHGDSEIYYRRSTNSGETWEDERRLTNAPGISHFITSCIRSDHAGGLHVVWDDTRDGNFEIYHKYSLDGGENWLKENRITDHAGNSHSSSLCVDLASTVHVTWSDDRDGNEEIYYIRSSDQGKSWNTAIPLTENTTESLVYGHSICADNNNGVHVIWRDFIGEDQHLFYRRSDDGGQYWTPCEILTSTENKSYRVLFPCICFEPPETIHVAWNQHIESMPKPDLSYLRSSNRGLTWEKEIRLTYDPAYTNYPYLCTDFRNCVHLVFEDWRSGSNFSEIHYKRGFQYGLPKTDIKINNEDGPLSIHNNEDITVSISLDPGNLTGVYHDWWLFGCMDNTYYYWFSYPYTWTISQSPVLAIVKPLVNINDYIVAKGRIPLTGSWVFTFAVDTANDNYECLFTDEVVIDVY